MQTDRRLVAVDRLRQRMGRAGRRRAEEHCPPQVQQPRLLALLSSLGLDARRGSHMATTG